jgi:hypothetical protein
MRSIPESYTALADAYLQLIEDTKELGQAQLELFLAQKAKDQAEYLILNEYNDLRRYPKGLAEFGSNKETRDARLYQMLDDEYEAISAAEEKLLLLRNALSVSQLRVDLYRKLWEHIKVSYECGSILSDGQRVTFTPMGSEKAWTVQNSIDAVRDVNEVTASEKAQRDLIDTVKGADAVLRKYRAEEKEEGAKG